MGAKGTPKIDAPQEVRCSRECLVLLPPPLRVDSHQNAIQNRGKTLAQNTKRQHYIRCRMAEEPQPRKIPLIFYRPRPESEPVREWLKGLPNGRHSGMPTGHRHCARNRSFPIAWRSASRETVCGKSGRTCRRNGRRACCSAFTAGTLSRCTGLSRKRARRRMMIWHWRASVRRS